MIIPQLSLAANLVIVYVGLAGGTAFMCYGLTNQRVGLMGMMPLTGLVAVVNCRYGIKDTGETIAFFNSIYDPFYNIGATGNMTNYPGLARCFNDNNNCSLLKFEYHAAWAATFHRRFTSAPEAAFNCARLYSHVWMNTTAFIICLIQFHEPTRRQYLWLHRKLGWAAISLVTGGTLSALWLGSEHGNEELYGGKYGVAGWFSMGATLFSTLIAGVLAVRRGDIAGHKKWMTRFYGSMWGAFLVFRIVFLLGGFFRWHKILMVQIAVWGSAPLGVAIAEWVRVRQQHDVKATSAKLD